MRSTLFLVLALSLASDHAIAQDWLKRLLRPKASPSLNLNLSPAAKTVHPELRLDELAVQIHERAARVQQFAATKQLAKELGVRVWLFGGTAASWAHYVRWDMFREAGDTSFQAHRFDYTYFNIFRSTQDIDLVIDGTAEQAQRLEQALKDRFAFFQGKKSAWEVRLLKQNRGDKEALLGNPDFFNQNTDSHSTGLIELTDAPQGEASIRDVRDWDATGAPRFLKDVHEGKLHFYSSPLHRGTARYKAGLNPEIFSVVRYFTKAFQFELDIQPADVAEIERIIGEFNPKLDLRDGYASGWLDRNGPKLFQNAVNLEFAARTLDRLGLRKKLLDAGKRLGMGELAFWMGREPLPSFAVGQGKGRTAAELGIDVVAHETTDFQYYESITRAHTGEPNVLKSRKGHDREAAMFGNGFYTAVGKQGARGTGITVRFKVDPSARLGTDFLASSKGKVGAGAYVVFLNRAAFRVIPEDLNYSLVEYFELLASGYKVDFSDRAVQYKFRNRLRAETLGVSEEEKLKIRGIVEDALLRQGNDAPDPLPLLIEYGNLPFAKDLPLSIEVSKVWLDALKRQLTLEKLDTNRLTTFFEIQNNPYAEEGLKLVIENTVIDTTGKNFSSKIYTLERFLETLALKSDYVGHPLLIDYFDRFVRTSFSGQHLFMNTVLADPRWAAVPKAEEWVAHFAAKGDDWDYLFRDVLSGPFWAQHPKGADYVITSIRGTKESWLNYVQSGILETPHWQSHPRSLEIFEELILRAKAVRYLGMVLYDLKSWKFPVAWSERSDVKNALEGRSFTIENLALVIADGKVTFKSCVKYLKK